MNDSDNPANWVELYADLLFKRALLLVDKTEVAEDLVQDTFLSAFKNLQTFQGNSSIKTWLVSILRNKAIDHLRKAFNREILTDFNDEIDHDDPDFNRWGVWKDYQQKWRIWESSPEDILETRGLRKALSLCLSKLPTNQRTIVKLKLIEGLSTEQICKDLDLAASNVLVLLFRARLALRNCLDINWFSKQ